MGTYETLLHHLIFKYKILYKLFKCFKILKKIKVNYYLYNFTKRHVCFFLFVAWYFLVKLLRTQKPKMLRFRNLGAILFIVPIILLVRIIITISFSSILLPLNFPKFRACHNSWVKIKFFPWPFVFSWGIWIEIV